MAKDNSGMRQTKIEKTGDKTFNVHTERGDVFECNSPQKLDKLKNVTEVKSDTPTLAGIGKKADLICDKCKAKVSRVQGQFDQKFKKIIYVCENCK